MLLQQSLFIEQSRLPKNGSLLCYIRRGGTLYDYKSFFRDNSRI